MDLNLRCQDMLSCLFPKINTESAWGAYYMVDHTSYHAGVVRTECYVCSIYLRLSRSRHSRLAMRLLIDSDVANATIVNCPLDQMTPRSQVLNYVTGALDILTDVMSKATTRYPYIYH